MTSHFCTNCGEPLNENDQFCTSCGAKVNAGSSPPRQKASGKPQASFPWFLILGGVLIVIAGIWWGISPKTEALPTPAIAIEQPTETTEIPYPNVPRASVEEVKAALDAGTAIVVDVRGLQYYQNAHVAGAISMPTDDLQLDYQTLPQDQMIYLYCT